MRLLVLVLVIVLSGCAAMRHPTSTTWYEGEKKMVSTQDLGVWGPTLKVLEIYTCVPADQAERIAQEMRYQGPLDGYDVRCDGVYLPTKVVEGFQTGVMAGFVGPTMTGVGTAAATYFGLKEVGQGIGDSGSETNVSQQGGGASATGGSAGSLNVNSSHSESNPVSISNGGNSSSRSTIRPRWGCD